MKLLLAVLLLLVATALGADTHQVSQPSPKLLKEDPDMHRSAPELIISRGFPVETHFATTPDGFILQMFRIPKPGSPVVFLQHGVLDSADTWLLMDRNSSLGYMFADAGFDVWIGNSRGNKYSRNHTSLNPDNWPFNGKFWDWTWDDMAQKDIPTQIDYALSHTGRAKLVYVGHSQGTTQMFANLATSAWNASNKIDVFVALAPVAYIYNTPSILIKALSVLNLDSLVQFFQVHEFLPTSDLLKWLLPEVCKATPKLCDTVIYLFCGLDLGDLDQDRLPTYVAHFPSGTSVKDISHWAQGVRVNDFRMYDYGWIGNEINYHSLSPPDYNFGSIVSPPIALFYGGQDDLSDPKDVERMIRELPKSTVIYTQLVEEYGHLDFVWGVHAHEGIYPKTIELAKKYSS